MFQIRFQIATISGPYYGVLLESEDWHFANAVYAASGETSHGIFLSIWARNPNGIGNDEWTLCEPS